MKAKQIISLMLLASLLVSCGEAQVTDDGDQTSSLDTTTQADGNDRESLDDGLPEKDYGNESFVIATEKDFEWMVCQEESTGDVIDDAIYARNIAVEDRFKIKIEYISDDYSALSKKIVSMVQSGDDEVDLCMTHVVESGKNALEGMYLNWYDIPYVDFSKPWWSDSTVEDLSSGNVCLLAVGDFALSALAKSYCMFYNQQLADEYKIVDLYKTVKDGKWTIDYLQSITKDLYSDINANGKIDGEDRFGFITTCRSALNAYLWAFGEKVLEKDKNDNIELVYHSAKTGEIVEKLCKVFYENDGIYINSKEAEYSFMFSLNCFVPGRAVFINSTIGDAVTTLREMEDDYGILPYPKWDENQADYATMVDGSHDVLCVPTTVQDIERTGIITEALCAETYKKVVPSYYEVALKTKYTRDDESIEVLDMIVNSRVFDLGYVYDGWKGASFIFQKLISVNDPNFESHWASNESAINAHYDEVIEYFQNYGK